MSNYKVTNLSTTQLTNYPQFNNFNVTGRISNSEVISSKNGDFLSVTIITTCMKNDEGMSITFNDSNALMGLFNKGYLPKGRQVTISGHVAYVTSTYTDSRTNEVRLLKRPRMHLVDVSIPTGGLGPLPREEGASSRTVSTAVVRPSDATNQAPAVDEVPVF